MAGEGIPAQQAVEPQKATVSAASSTKDSLWKTGGRRMGCWQPGGALPQPGSSFRSSLPHGPGLQATLGALGLQPGPQGAMPAWPLSPGDASSWVLCGAGRGEVKAEGTSQAGRRLSQRACSPPPFPRTGLASLGYKRGAGTMGVLCPGEAPKDPRPTP